MVSRFFVVLERTLLLVFLLALLLAQPLVPLGFFVFLEVLLLKRLDVPFFLFCKLELLQELGVPLFLFYRA